MPYVSQPSFGGLWDSLKSVASAVIPKKTIVGKLLSGDVSGAVAGTVKLASGSASKPPAPALPPPQAGKSGPGVFSPGGFVEKNQTILLLVAAGLAAFLVLGRKKK